MHWETGFARHNWRGILGHIKLNATSTIAIEKKKGVRKPHRIYQHQECDGLQ